MKIVLILAAALPLLAHHSTAQFDLVHGTVIAGVVTKFEWQNPHAHIELDVQGEDEEIEHWSIELESINILRRYGWAKDTLKPGDSISIAGGRAKNGSFHLRAVYVEFPDGRRMPALPVPEK